MTILQFKGSWYWLGDALLNDAPEYGKSVCETILAPSNDGRLFLRAGAAKAFAAVPDLVRALQQWTCTACGGEGVYWFNKTVTLDLKAKGRALSTKYNPEKPVPCKRCNGHKIEPIARAALIAAGVIKEGE